MDLSEVKKQKYLINYARRHQNLDEVLRGITKQEHVAPILELLTDKEVYHHVHVHYKEHFYSALSKERLLRIFKEKLQRIKKDPQTFSVKFAGFYQYFCHYRRHPEYLSDRLSWEKETVSLLGKALHEIGALEMGSVYLEVAFKGVPLDAYIFDALGDSLQYVEKWVSIEVIESWIKEKGKKEKGKETEKKPGGRKQRFGDFRFRTSSRSHGHEPEPGSL